MTKEEKNKNTIIAVLATIATLFVIAFIIYVINYNYLGFKAYEEVHAVQSVINSLVH